VLGKAYFQATRGIVGRTPPQCQSSAKAHKIPSWPQRKPI